MTIAQMQTIDDAVAAAIRQVYQQQDDEEAAQLRADVEVDAEIEALGKVVDGDSVLRSMLNGTKFADAFNGEGDHEAQRAATAMYEMFIDRVPAKATAATADDMRGFVNNAVERTGELELLARPRLRRDDPIDPAQLSGNDRAIYELEGEGALRDAFRLDVSDWLAARQRQDAAISAVERGESVEDPPTSGVVTIIDGKSYGDEPTVDAAMPRGFGEDVVEYDAGDREQDARRRAAERERTGADNRTANEVAAGMKMPGEETPPQPSAQPSPPPPTEHWPTPWWTSPSSPSTRTPRAEPAAEREAETSAAFPGEIAPDSEYRQPKGPGWAAFDLPGHR